ncbi:unnamed protein product [Diatraea saccharalis]|uniref:Uncharacterized protein n=1 Tax=Diatraea saccharalis TaxID=40085 RepID=A0A9N9R643_9NEOP|nr:unnamed protein product [Diatraea saccharalis]
MGRASGDGKPRPILLKVRDIAMRDKIWFAQTVLKKSGITISEFHTKTRHDVFMAACDAFGMNKCFTQQGVIIVIGADGKRMRINTMDELNKIIVSLDSAKETPRQPTITLPSKPVISMKRRRAGVVNKN